MGGLRKPIRPAMPRHPHTTQLLCLCLTLPGCESGRSYSLPKARLSQASASSATTARRCSACGTANARVAASGRRSTRSPPILTTCARKATSRCPGKLPLRPFPTGFFRSRQIPSAALSAFLRTKKESLSPLSERADFSAVAVRIPLVTQRQPGSAITGLPSHGTGRAPAPHVRPHPLSPEDRR